MGDRTLRNIENVKVGDTVLTYNFERKKQEVNPILEIEEAQENKLIEIVFENYIIIVSTEDHPYYIKGKGLCSFNPELTFKKFGIKTNKLEVFDLLGVKPIANSNNCFINGILINNGK
jgi:intein/homing endonuclease